MRGWGHEVRLTHPSCELRLKILPVDELAPLEEGVLHPLHEVLDRTLLVAAARRAHLCPHAELEHHLGKDRIEALHFATDAALGDDRARSVEHGEQRHTAERNEVADQRSHQRLDALIRHQRHGDEARVLQSRREEVDPLLGAVDVTHIDVPEVMLRELARQSLEAHHRRRTPRTNG